MIFNLYRYSQRNPTDIDIYTDIGHSKNMLVPLENVYLYSIDKHLNFLKVKADQYSLHSSWLGEINLDSVCSGRVDTARKIASMLRRNNSNPETYSKRLLERTLRENMGDNIKVYWF